MSEQAASSAQTIAGTLAAVLASDPFLRRSVQSPGASLPALAGVSQMPSLQTLVLSGLYSQAAAINAAFTTVQTTTVIPGVAAVAGSPSGRSVNSSNAAVVTAAATPSATVASYNVQVNSLAVAQVTDGISVKKTTAAGLSDGTLGISIGGAPAVDVAFSVLPADTNATVVNNIASAINGAFGSELSATVVNDLAAHIHIQITALTPGTRGAFSIAAAVVGGIPDVNGTLAVTAFGLDNAPSAAAQDASYTLNAMPATATSGNTTTIDSGNLTLNFLSTGNSTVTVTATGGSPSSPATSPTVITTTSIVGDVENFVVAFNNLQDYLSANSSHLNPQIQQEMSGFVAANAAPLAAIGLTANPNGTLSANDTTLNSVATANPSTVQSLLFGATGLAGRVSSLAQGITNSLQAQPPSPISAATTLTGSGGVAVNLLA